MPTIESLCNQALDLVGYKRHIGNIYEGSVASRVALDLWAETRDTLLEKLQPEWARRDIVLNLLRAAPNIVNGTARYDAGWNASYPALPWLYEYNYPVDSISPLQIKSSQILLPQWRPRYIPFRLNNTTGIKSILTNQEDAILTCVGQILDPNDWHDEFITQMKLALARQFEPTLAPEMHQRRQQQQQQAQAEQNADTPG